MQTHFDKIKTFSSLQTEFIISEENVLVLEKMRLFHLKHKIIPNSYYTLYEIEINEEYFIKMKDNDMKYYYQEFHKRVFNNLILHVYHLFSEERKPNYYSYLIFEKSEFIVSECFSFKNQAIFFNKKAKSVIIGNNDLRSIKIPNLLKSKSIVLNEKFFNLAEEDSLIQMISFYYDVMSLLVFLENKKYHFSFYFQLINPMFLFVSRIDNDEKFVFHIEHKYIIKFLLLPEPLLEYMFYNTSFFQNPIKYFFRNLNSESNESSFNFEPSSIYPILKKIAPFYNIYMSSKLFLDILQTINNSNLSKQSYNLKQDMIKLLNRSIDHFVLETLITKQSERFSHKHFLNSYYKELKNFLQVYVFSEKIKQIFSKTRSRVYQYVIIKEVTQSHILQKILENTNPLVKSLNFSDCRIDPNFFKDITVAFQFLEELIIRNVNRISKCYRLEEIQLKSLIYSGKMKNLRILDLAGNSIKLTGPLFVNKVESASLREKALPNIIELNLSKNDLKCEDCQMILQEPVFGNVRKINLSENCIDLVFKAEKGYSLLSKLESLNFSKNQLKDFGSQHLFESYGLESLRKLDLSYNRIIFPAKLSHLINLRILKLDYNLINSNGCQSIFSNISLKNIEELSLVGNSIKQPLTKETVNNLIHLKKLNLSKNLIAGDLAKVIFEQEFRLDNLIELDLSNNSIDTIIPAKEKLNANLLKTINFLNLSFNHITDEGANMIFNTNFENILMLNLNFNEIWEPVNEDYKLQSLIILDLNNNRITDTGCQRIFEKLNPFCKLRKLDLQRNRITNPVDLTVDFPENSIEKINFNFNTIDCKGSQSLFLCKKFEHLKELIMASNKIIIPIKENQIKNLTRLTLANNKINSIGSQSIFNSENFEELNYLDLYRNLIEIPLEETNLLKELNELDLANNKINSQGSNWIFSNKNFENLEKLNLNNNQIQIPFETNNLINLQHLNMKRNKINSEGCQAIFQNPNLKNLKKLYLEHNVIEISVVSTSKCFLNNLYKISLAHNKISSEGCQNLLKMKQLDHLEIISLSRNQIEFPLDVKVPCDLKNLRRLNLSFNPIKFEGIAPIFYCPGLKNLETIKIMECELEEVIDTNKPVELGKLRYLLAAQNKINSRGSQNIFLAENLKNLQILDLCNNEIEVPTLLEIPVKPKLSTILLSRNKIGSDAGETLFGCKAFEKLLNLDLSDNNLQRFDLEKFGLWSLAQLNLIDNNLDYESNKMVDELNNKMKVLF